MTLSFEAAYARLEEILEKINSGKLALDESLQLFEEADKIIVLCSKKLSEAEQRIEVLLKNREGELIINVEGKPQTQDFQTRGS